MPATLSCFSGTLLRRTHAALGNPGLFGQLVQCLLAPCLRVIHGQYQDNPGAGVPDGSYTLHDGANTAVEIKYTADGEIALSDRDVLGLGTFADGAARLLVLDISLPPCLWVLDARTLVAGKVRPAAYAALHVRDDADALAARLEELLRGVDTDLVPSQPGDVQACKSVAAEWVRSRWRP